MSKVKSNQKLFLFALMMLIMSTMPALSGCSGGNKPDENKSSIRATIEKPEAKIKEATESHQKQIEADIESLSASAPKY